MNTKPHKSRRDFIKKAVGTALLSGIAPTIIHAKPKNIIEQEPQPTGSKYSANDQVKVSVPPTRAPASMIVSKLQSPATISTGVVAKMNIQPAAESKSLFAINHQFKAPGVEPLEAFQLPHSNNFQ